jgi:hypothetical protein
MRASEHDNNVSNSVSPAGVRFGAFKYEVGERSNNVDAVKGEAEGPGFARDLGEDESGGRVVLR